MGWFVSLSLEMEAPDTAACFVDDLLDFASDIGEEDDDEGKHRKALPPLNRNGLEPVSFNVLDAEDAGHPFAVSCLSGHLCLCTLKGDMG